MSHEDDFAHPRITPEVRMKDEKYPVELTTEEQAAFDLALKKSTAIREAMVEVMQEFRAQIIERARAKLVAQGISISDEEAGTAL